MRVVGLFPDGALELQRRLPQAKILMFNVKDDDQANVKSLQLDQESPAVTLTKREEQLLELLGQAMTNKEIARRLYLQPQTVKHYVHLIFQKFDVHDRLDVIRMIRGAKR